MKLLSVKKFSYPGFMRGDYGWCEVDVYRHPSQPHLLVVLKDHDDHGSTIATNALEMVCEKVHRELLVPNGLGGLEAHWVHWSRADDTACTVYFIDKTNFALPEWEYLSPQDFATVVEGFGAEGQLELDTWEETRGEGRIRKDKPN